MNRREVIVGSSLSLLARAALAQQASRQLIGCLSSRSPEESKHLAAAFPTGGSVLS
jgi:hypothetical protein